MDKDYEKTVHRRVNSLGAWEWKAVHSPEVIEM